MFFKVPVVSLDYVIGSGTASSSMIRQYFPSQLNVLVPHLLASHIILLLKMTLIQLYNHHNHRWNSGRLM